jgi:hypothetical protein
VKSFYRRSLEIDFLVEVMSLCTARYAEVGVAERDRMIIVNRAGIAPGRARTRFHAFKGIIYQVEAPKSS